VLMALKILTNLHALLAYAIGEKLIATNDARGIKVIGRRDEGAKKVVPPPKIALRALLSVADADNRIFMVLGPVAPNQIWLGRLRCPPYILVTTPRFNQSASACQNAHQPLLLSSPLSKSRPARCCGSWVSTR